jgi:primosomal protein N' (replication factor Y)
MPSFCDVALPVPLETCFTYRLNGVEPVVGGRVLVPFRNLRLPGVVTALHDRAPSVEAKNVLEILDVSPVLDPELMRLAEWIAHYYLAPLGEVFRTMLPLAAEVKRARAFRITETGWAVLHESAERGSSRRSKMTADEQMLEYRVLDYLSARDGAREQTLRAALRASREMLAGMVRKGWITAEDVSSARDARLTRRVVQLKEVSGKLNDNQRKLVEALAASGGRAPLEHLRGLDVPRSTLQTLVRRGIMEISEQPAEFAVSRLEGKPALDFPLNSAQAAALERIRRRIEEKRFSVTLLFGVTGSGKTAVYLSAMQDVLAAGRSAILLVPEIGLTPQAAANLYEIFGKQVAILHSALSDAERAEQWHRIRKGEARVVVGTRSAVFAPVRDLALIVVDEEQDASYKQEEMPRYHGRDVAILRGKICGAAVVLGSATPAMESFHNAQDGKYALLELPNRVEQRPLPEVELVDMRAEFQQAGEDQVFSHRLVEEIRERLDRGEQAMILLNRRGYSPVVLCRACGETMQCQNCAIAMTHHRRAQRLLCHYCGYQAPVPKACPKCASEYVYFLGTGSEKLEDLLHGAFPTARIGRLDRDTVRGRGDFERVLSALHADELDLLVGTQMIAKGHDIHGITLVGVVGADFALGFPDFRAAERTFQLLTQVAGRAGRGSTPGKVVLQTYFPEHYAIRFAERHDYRGFYEKELQYRRWMHYPPFTALANVLVRSDEMTQALKYSSLIGRWLEKNPPQGVRVLGPASAPLARLKREYRYHFILKSQSRERLNAVLRALLDFAAGEKIPRGRMVVDVDPVSLL